jgi:hypothetical protein
MRSIEQLVEAFMACTLPKAEWTHQAHLSVGLWHLLHYSPQESITKLRRDIKRYNLACGIENTEMQAYHETITQFYVRIIQQFLQESDRTQSIDELAQSLTHEYGDKNLPFQYYSRTRLLSATARKEWIEPDLQRLNLLEH